MDKAKKKGIKRYFTWACLAALVLVLTVMPLLAKNEAASDGPQASILSATAELGSITTSLRGGGTLEDQDESDVNIPTGVKITEFLVKNGDIVAEGTPLAVVDKVSVMAAITSVSETLEYLQAELEDGRGEKVEEILTAVPGGRVKKIFAQEGETVQEVMLRDGCLAVLSIDSMMAVQVATPSSLGTGEHVDVTLADGTVVTGRVESNLDGIVVITVEDEGYEVGQQVSVKDLGTGTLYIHNAWKATAYAGTISKINAKEEQTLKAGARLFTLTDRDFAGQLQHRANQHREYEALLQTLLQMYASGTIDAPCEGIVSGVDSDSVHFLAADGGCQVELLTGSQEPAYRIVFLDNTLRECEQLAGCTEDSHDPDCIRSCDNNNSCDGNDHLDTCPKKCTGVSGCTADQGKHDASCPEACIQTKNEQTACPANDHKSGCIHGCAHADATNVCKSEVHFKDCVQGCSGSETCTSSKHRSDCIKRCIHSNGSKDCPALTHYADCIEKCSRADKANACGAEKYHYNDCIEACIVSKSVNEECPATKHFDGCHYNGMTYTAYVAVVDYVGSAELGIYKDAGTEYKVEKSGSGWQIVSPQLNTDLMITQDKVTVSNAKDFQKNDIILLVTAKKNGKAEKSFVVLYQKSMIGDTDVGGLVDGLRDSMSGLSGLGGLDISGLTGSLDLSSMLGGFAGYGNFAGMNVEDGETLHDLDGSTLMTVTPHKTMKLTISLDEQDIASVTPGMTAKVKVEALKNQEFTAQIISVGISGTNYGGSSKFAVELELDAVADMLPGMSAAADIELGTKADVLVLPVEAVWELDGKTVVYTGLDKNTGEPSSPVEVVTGLSDGIQVEIISGIAQGDTVYYSYYDTLELDTSAEANRFTLG